MSASPSTPHTFRWKRLAVGMAVIAVLAIMHGAASALSGDGVTVYWLAFWLLGVPVNMLPLFVSFTWGTRRGFGPTQTLLTTLVVAAFFGGIGGAGACYLMRHHPQILPPPAREPTYLGTAGFGVVFGVLMCALWALAFIYPFALEDAKLRALEAEKLKLEAEKLRSSAELARLRTQLEPHFILNTLNAIAGFTTQEPQEARRLIGCLGDLLRDVLHDADEMQTLGEEIAWLRRYAEILEARHAGSLHFRWELARGTHDVLLPRLLLQPLVENAVKHGALRRKGGGQVRIQATITRPAEGAARLVCTVEDNGPGMAATPPRSGAFGIRSVRRRIELKYTDGCLRIDSSPEGTRTVLDLPCATAREPMTVMTAGEAAR